MKKIKIQINDGNIIRENPINGELKYNDKRKYIEYIPDILEPILKEFPEYIAGETPIITNTGLVYFNGEYAYDLTENEDNSWDTIIPDFVSTTSMYTEYNNPLGIRKLDISNDGKFKGKVFYSYNYNNTKDIYCFLLDCDKLNNNFPDSDGLYRLDSYIYDRVCFAYKQMYTLISHNCKISSIFISSENESAVNLIDISLDQSTDTISVDCSNFYVPYICLQVTLENISSNAYIEVI